MFPLIPRILSNVEAQRANIQEKGLVLNLNKTNKRDIENDGENRRGHPISIEHLVSDNPNLAVNEAGLISLLGYSMYFSSSLSHSNSKPVDLVPTSRFRYEISSTDRSS
jgi:hypothetical protein